MNESTVLWAGFNLFVLGMLALDLGVFHRKSHTVTVREALIWTGVWVTLALFFNLFIYFYLVRNWPLSFLLAT
jgi:tellurite resistance protein TerC